VGDEDMKRSLDAVILVVRKLKKKGRNEEEI